MVWDTGSRSAATATARVRVPSVAERPSAATVAVGAGRVVVGLARGGTVTIGAVVGVVVGAAPGSVGVGPGTVGVTVTGGATRKVTGMTMSCERSEVRVWSLRVTIAHRTWRQSMPGLISARTVKEVEKLPPGP